MGLAVCVTGMHRSGTSMVADLLHHCGFYLGEDNELMPPSDDNPQGYWENLAIDHFNDLLLTSVRASWQHPPTDTHIEWQKLANYPQLVEQAQKLIAPLQTYPLWAWKDPRTSLTLGFWQELLPDLRVVVCLRNPLEVAQSLAQRNDSFSVKAGVELWESYYDHLLANPQCNQFLISHYETFFYDAEAELKRILAFLGVDVPPPTLAEAVGRFMPDLRRNVFSFEWAKLVSTETARQYQELSQQAGPIYQRMQVDQDFQNRTLHENLKQLESRYATLQLELADSRKENMQLTTANQNVVTILREIQSYRSWRVVNKWWHLRSRVLPVGAWQEGLYFGAVTFVESLIKFGPRIALRKWFAQRRNSEKNTNYIPPQIKERSYRAFIYKLDPSAKSERLHSLAYQVEQWDSKPSVAIATALNEAIDPHTYTSVLQQNYPYWVWYWVGKPTDTQPPDARIKVIQDLSEITEAHFLVLDNHDQLAPHALFNIADLLRKYPNTDIIYTDHDIVDSKNTLQTPQLKPHWSPERFFSGNDLDHGTVFKRNWVNYDILNPATRWTIYWEIAEQAPQIHHISQVLYHHAPTTLAISERQQQAQAIQDYFKRHNLQNGQLTADNVPSWTTERKVSIIIPSRDHVRVLEPCLRKIFNVTDFPNYEVLVVDTGSTEAATFALYAEYKKYPNFKVVPYEGVFNFSRACNVGAQAASGDLFLFLNNDTEVLTSDWLGKMAQWFEIPEIGIVGPKLLYPDGKLQHAGVIIGLSGLVEHLFKGGTENQSTIFGSDNEYRNLLGVTGACLMISREAFERVEGFSEAYQLNFSDIDLCLRVHAIGYRILYTPHVRLLHHESVTHQRRIPRLDFDLACDAYRYWLIQGDPYFNGNLDYGSPMPRFSMSIGESSYMKHLAAMSKLPHKDVIVLPDDMT